MAENKTVKYHIPHRGIYMYSHVYEGKTEMIVLNSTGSEQILDSECYTVLTKDSPDFITFLRHYMAQNENQRVT